MPNPVNSRSTRMKASLFRVDYKYHLGVKCPLSTQSGHHVCLLTLPLQRVVIPRDNVTPQN